MSKRSLGRSAISCIASLACAIVACTSVTPASKKGSSADESCDPHETCSPQPPARMSPVDSAMSESSAAGQHAGESTATPKAESTPERSESMTAGAGGRVSAAGSSSSVPAAGSGSGERPASACTVDGKEYAKGAAAPGNVCQYCDPSLDSHAFSDRVQGAPCDDGLYCNGRDSCQGGTCSMHSGMPCGDDGLFCNGVEVCDEENDKCTHHTVPCLDDDNACNGQPKCDEANDKCVPGELKNDCSSRSCGPSPSGCFMCGQCAVAQTCSKAGACECKPAVAQRADDTPLALPGDWSPRCFLSTDSLDQSRQCYVVTCGNITYWGLTHHDNRLSFNVVGYDAAGTIVSQKEYTGSRYLVRITLDPETETATFLGQGDTTAKVPFSEFWR